MQADARGRGHRANPRNDALHPGTAKKSSLSGSVTLHYFTHIRETSLDNCLDSITRLYPDIHVNVLHDDDPAPSLDALRKNVADILILPGTVMSEHFVEHHRWSDHYVLVTAKGKQGMPRHFTELAQSTRYVAWRHAGLERLHAHLAAAQLRLCHRGELSCLETLLDLVSKGRCMSILPSALLTGQVEQVPLPASFLRHIGVVARPASLLSNAACAVLQALRKPSLMAVRHY